MGLGMGGTAGVIDRIGVGQRVGLLGALGVVGLLLVGGIYLYGQSAEAPLQARADRFGDSYTQLSAMSGSLAEARQLEAEFFLRPSEGRAEQHLAGLQTAQDSIEAVRHAIDMPAPIMAGIQTLADDVRHYAGLSAVAGGKQRILGLGPTSGLQGQLMLSRTALETSLVAMDDPSLLRALRAWHQTEAVGPALPEVPDAIGGLTAVREALALGTSLTDPAKARIGELIDAHERDLLAYGAAKYAWFDDLQAASQAYEKVRNAGMSAVWLVTEQLRAEQAALARMQSGTAGLMRLALLLTIGAVALLAWRIGRGIANPLSRVAALTRRLASGDVAWSAPFQDRRDEIGDVARALSICRDTMDTNRIAIERINDLAHHDPLTGLANRTLLQDRLQAAVDRARSGEVELAVLCLDLDGFKAVNDLYGHGAGDQLLQRVSRRINAEVGPAGLVARLGGDEFVVLHEEPGQPRAAITLAERLMGALSEPYRVGDNAEVCVTVSIGVALSPADDGTVETLLRNADTALYRAKWAGKNRLALFLPEMDHELRECRALEHDLHHAVANREFRLAWQPLARTCGGEVTGFEVLLRWDHPQRGLISPEQFIPVAEACGAICAIGEWVLREACREAARLPASLHVAVNVSPIQAQQGEAFAAIVEDALATSGLDPSRLMLEVTEGVLIREPGQVLAALCRLKLLGVRVALDDFGTGYSSLATLRAFPFDKIKIDRSFTFGVTNSGQDAAIVRAVLGLARGLGVPVVAEGVETQAQLQALQSEGCEEVQGWLIGRPAPIGSFALPHERALVRDAA